MNKVYDVAVVGAGAAGLFTAVHCAKRGKSVILYDKNKYPGRKLRITGKGRCNICNYSDNDNILKNIVHNEKFMYSSLNNYSAKDLIKFFNDNGIKTKVERGNRVFPESDDAMEIIEMFKKLIKDLNIEFKNESTVKNLEKNEDLFKIVSNSGVDYAKNLVIACGGMSYKVTGSNGDGYKLAQKFGHSIKPIKASLVAMNTSLSKEDRLELMGLSLRNVEVKVINQKKKTIFTEFGEMLFTHFGISGPIILSASSYILDYYKKACDITKLERTAIINNLKHFNLKYDSLRDIDEAIITAGGVNVKEIDPKTMESKLVNKLYIVGEVLDIDALTGGYNLQIAFSTAYQAAMSIE